MFVLLLYYNAANLYKNHTYNIKKIKKIKQRTEQTTQTEQTT